MRSGASDRAAVPLAAAKAARRAALFAAAALAAAGIIVDPARAESANVDVAAWPALPPEPAADPKLDAFVDGLIAKMSLEEKVGQLIQADIATIRPEDIARYPLGSILNGGDSSPDMAARVPAPVWLKLADAFYQAARDRKGTYVPLMWGIDAVHGQNKIIGATIFPHNIGLGATRDPALIEKIGEITAQEVTVTGQDWVFAPTVAVARDDHWGRTYESYSEDPSIVATSAAALIKGLQGEVGTPDFLGAGHVIATAKHFLGDGGTNGGKDQGDTLASEPDLIAIHAPGYVAALKAGVQTIMASYSSWRGLKMHADRALLTDVLKGRMGFAGFVVGDWNGHEQVPGCTKSDCPIVTNAGVDMLMAPDGWRDLFAAMVREAKDGTIPAARLDDAVRRVLAVKVRAGLFEKPRPSARPFAGKFDLLGAPEHRAVARQAVRESLVLLKNEGSVLPLKPSRRILVAGDAADDIGRQSGGWTLSWQGGGNINADFPNGQSIYAGIAEAVEAGGGTVHLSPKGEFQDAPGEKPDAAIVVIGERPYAETKGDLATTSWSAMHPEDLALLQRLKAAGIPLITVFLSGRPLWVDPELDASDAFVAAWLPGSEGGGIADLLFEKPDGSRPYDFRGKLSFSWPRVADQVVNVGDVPYEPRFPVGYGLTLGGAPAAQGTTP